MPKEHIFTSKDMSPTGKSRDWMLKLKSDIEKRRGLSIKINSTLSNNPVYARIYRGFWIADCDRCNGAMFVSYDDPVFFCMDCMNVKEHGKLRPIIFPENREEIEQAILERPAVDGAGGQVFTRDWIPGETAEMIRQQNTVIAGLKRKGK